MRWLEGTQPLVDRRAGPRRPDGVPCTAGLSYHASGSGWLVVRSETGGWAHLNSQERLRLADPSSMGSDSLDALWGRGLLAVDGQVAWLAEQRDEAITSTQDTFMLVLLLNEGCNLVCSYCYLGHASPAKTMSMSEKTARDAIDDAVEGRHAKVLIDFGEIAVAEPVFRRLVPYAADRFAVAGKKLSMSIQTNGTTLDDELAKFLAYYGVTVGISVDGPAHLHDAARTFRSGAGSHELAVDAIERCKSLGIGVHIPVTIARHNVDHPEAVLSEIDRLRPGSHLLKPVLPEGEAGEDWQGQGISVEEYASFMARAVRRAAEIDLDLLDTTATKFLRRLVWDRRGWGDGCTSRQCSSGRTLQVVDRHGARHACPRFVSSSPAKVTKLTIRRRLPSPSADLLSPTLRTAPPTCGGCSWLQSCGGGCTLAARDPEGLTPLPDPNCPSHISVHEALVEQVLPILLDNGQRPGRIAAGIRSVESGLLG